LGSVLLGGGGAAQEWGKRLGSRMKANLPREEIDTLKKGKGVLEERQSFLLRQGKETLKEPGKKRTILRRAEV